MSKKNGRNYKINDMLADLAHVYELDGPAFILIKDDSRFGNPKAIQEITRQANLLGWGKIVVAVVKDFDEIAHYDASQMNPVGWFHRDQIEARIRDGQDGIELLKYEIEYTEAEESE